MPKLTWIPSVLAALVIGLLTLPAWATSPPGPSPIGTWRFDVDAARAKMVEAIETAVESYAPAQRESAREQMPVDELNASLDRLVGARVVFKEGGKAVTRSKDGREIVAMWQEQDGKIRLIEGDASQMTGTWDGDRLIFRYDVADRPQEEVGVILLREMQFIMVRE